MNKISMDFEGLSSFITEEEFESVKEKASLAHEAITKKTGLGSEMLGWFNYPNEIKDEEVQRIMQSAEVIGRECDVFVVIGIGGSYLGAKAVIDMLSNSFSNLQSRADRKTPQILFAGNNMSGKYLRDLIEYLTDKDFAINVISKSGRTLEPAIAFRTLKILLEKKYGREKASKRIYVTTDSRDGILKQIASKNDYVTFDIPRNVGGRYSVLTPVGLLPMAVAGIDIRDILDGAIFAQYVYNENNMETNDCYRYAIFRNLLHNKGKDIEVMASYEPSMTMFLEWYKQLFGESEGKDGKGIFPASVSLTTDLHSMGQLMQDGKRNFFETIINIKKDRSLINLPFTEINEDGLNYLSNTSIADINNKAFLGTLKAHIDGNVPCMVINIEELDAYNVGSLIYFFEKACAMSAYILGVNPFNQPGVEEYKNNMMRLLNEDKY